MDCPGVRGDPLKKPAWLAPSNPYVFAPISAPQGMDDPIMLTKYLKYGLICFSIALMGAAINLVGWHFEQRWLAMLGYGVAAIGVGGGVLCVILGAFGVILGIVAVSKQQNKM